MRFLLMGLLLGTAACRSAPDGNGNGHATSMAIALLQDAAGREVGRAVLTQVERGVQIVLEASGLPPGAHGFHIHEKGDCEAPEFKSAGGHFNPEGKEHGLENPRGSHAGDLPNLTVGRDGSVRFDVLVGSVTLAEGRRSILGRSLVIHERADDGRTDPDGNAGKRIACGIIRPAEDQGRIAE